MAGVDAGINIAYYYARDTRRVRPGPKCGVTFE